MPPEFFQTHWIATTVAGAFFLWISICFILRLWIIHHRAPFLKKLFWSIVLLIPGFGWLAYGALFHLPGFTDIFSADYSGSSLGGDGGYGGGHHGSYDSAGHGGYDSGGHGGGFGGGGHH